MSERRANLTSTTIALLISFMVGLVVATSGCGVIRPTVHEHIVQGAQLNDLAATQLRNRFLPIVLGADAEAVVRQLIADGLITAEDVSELADVLEADDVASWSQPKRVANALLLINNAKNAGALRRWAEGDRGEEETE